MAEEELTDVTSLRQRMDPELHVREEGRLRVPNKQQLQAVHQDINPRGYSKWPLERFVRAAHEGDLELLTKMLNREDPIDGYHHDFNAHHKPDGYNALQAAAMAGQLEAVQMLLEDFKPRAEHRPWRTRAPSPGFAARPARAFRQAGVDPHVKRSMPEGEDPKEGETSRELAEKHGWDDIAAALKEAEKSFPRGLYKEFGRNNNAKLWPIDRPEGLDPEQEQRAKAAYKKMSRPLPRKEDRLFYGDLVFGVNFGTDAKGRPIKVKKPIAPAENGAVADGQE
ncbi:Hypothetical protein SCF082_LOCUS23841 [Durusdinium trenchii]|uniref:Ankyrin repeat domain-containing protein n=1 Tax=Durusdinium trenchii TaxID=1381693 RepID=A0ABP0LSU5_9DINO